MLAVPFAGVEACRLAGWAEAEFRPAFSGLLYRLFDGLAAGWVDGLFAGWVEGRPAGCVAGLPPAPPAYGVALGEYPPGP